MFDSTTHDLDVLDIHEQAEDLICEIMAARDELMELYAGRAGRETSEWETHELMAEYELFIQHCHEELARLRYEAQWGIEDEPSVGLDVMADRCSSIDFEVVQLDEAGGSLDIAC